MTTIKSNIYPALAYFITYHMLGHRAFLYIQILAQFCQVVNDGEAFAGIYCMRSHQIGHLSVIPAQAGMTGRLRRNDLPEPGARQACLCRGFGRQARRDRNDQNSLSPMVRVGMLFKEKL